MNKNGIIVSRLMKAAYVLGAAFLIAAMVLSIAGNSVSATPVPKVYWCHVEPNGNSQTLHLPLAALENAGHVSASGSPLHAGDHPGQCVVSTPDPTQDPTPDPTQDPTPDPTQDPTPDPTQDPTPDPTQDPTPDPTQDPTPDPTQDPTPDPTQDPTPDPTEDPGPEVPPPTSNEDPAVLIPVTGIDLSGSPLSTVNFLQKITFNLGFAFLGLALVLTGVHKKLQ